MTGWHGWDKAPAEAPPAPDLTCARRDCMNDQTTAISLALYPSRNGIPATTSAMVNVCDEHAQSITPGELITDASWRQIEDKFRAIGQKVPIRGLTQIRRTPLS